MLLVVQLASWFGSLWLKSMSLEEWVASSTVVLGSRPSISLALGISLPVCQLAGLDPENTSSHTWVLTQTGERMFRLGWILGHEPMCCSGSFGVGYG